MDTIWLKIGDMNIRMVKKLTSNALCTAEPPILADYVGDDKVRSIRTVASSHWENALTGEVLKAETVLKNAAGEIVPTSAARNILEKASNLDIDAKGQKIDKAKMRTYIVNPDGSRGDEVAESVPTDIIEEVDSVDLATEPGKAVRVPASTMNDFLVHQQYDIVAAEIRNDAKAYAKAEELSKADEVLMTTFSNGGVQTLYYAFVRPYFSDDGKFQFELLISNKKVVRNLLRDIPAPTNAIKPAKAAPLLPSMAKMLIPAR